MIGYALPCILLAEQSPGVIKGVAEHLAGAADGKGTGGGGKECVHDALHVPRPVPGVVDGDKTEEPPPCLELGHAGQAKRTGPLS